MTWTEKASRLGLIFFFRNVDTLANLALHAAIFRATETENRMTQTEQHIRQSESVI